MQRNDIERLSDNLSLHQADIQRMVVVAAFSRLSLDNGIVPKNVIEACNLQVQRFDRAIRFRLREGLEDIHLTRSSLSLPVSPTLAALRRGVSVDTDITAEGATEPSQATVSTERS